MNSPALLTDPAALHSISTDASGTPGRPGGVIRPTTVDEVREAVRWCAAEGRPLVPRGAGTGMAGGAVATAGEVVLDLTGLDRVVRLDPDDQFARVEPGVITADLDARAREHGLFYAPDPASGHQSTIGGNIATNAGGMRCVKYGVTADSVLGLDVVLADGRLLHTGTATLKGVTGLRLTQLFVGSEGTLGVIVGATLRLRPVPAETASVAAAFDDVELAAAACSALAEARLTPSVLEFLDAATLGAIDAAEGSSLRARGEALVLAQADGPGASQQAELLAAVLGKEATWVEHSDDPAVGAELMSARRLAYPAIAARARTLIEDICVPRSRLAEAVRGVQQIAARTGVEIYTFAHAGDGNLHPIVTWDRRLPIAPEEVEEAAGQIFELAVRLGGTLSGEHGIGLLKRPWLGRELDEVNLDVHRLLKSALDPTNLLNPGKAF